MNLDTLIRQTLDDARVEPTALPDDRSIVERRAGRIRRNRTATRIVGTVASLVVVVGLVGVAVSHRDADDGRTDVAAPATSTTTSPAGDDAWLSVPTQTNGLPLQAVRVAGWGMVGAAPDAGPTSLDDVQTATLGTVTFNYRRTQSHTTLISYAFDPQREPWATGEHVADPSIGILTQTNVSVEAASFASTDGRPLTPVVAASGIQVVDLGDQCGAPGSSQLVGWLTTFNRCRHVVLGWSGDLEFTIDGPPGTNFDALLPALSVTTLPALEAQVRDAVDVDRLEAELARRDASDNGAPTSGG